MTGLAVARAGGALILTLDRPAAGNRITQGLAAALTEALEAARRDDAVAGCVLTGQGDVFCLGGDWRGAGEDVAARMEFGRAHADLADAMARLGKPLVAAVNGDAHAGGFALVTACDMAFVAEDATLGLPEAAHGLFPLLALGIVRDALPKTMLFDIVYNARLMTAAEACALHIANAALPRTEVLARAIATIGRTAGIDRNILMLGRDLYYAIRNTSPAEAMDQARFALGVALGARDEAGRTGQ